MKFDSVIFSPDLHTEMDEYSKTQAIQMEYLCSAFGVKIHVEKHLPPGTALFVNHIGEIVGLYSDGKLVEIAQDSAINYLAPYPLAIKKKPLLDQSDE